MRLRIAIAQALLFLAFALSGQRGFEAGGFVGAAHYFGDLNTVYRIDRPGLMAGAIGRYNFHDRVSARLSINYGRVSAYDSDSRNTYEQARNLSFRSDIFEGFLGLEFNFLPYIHGSNDQFFSPYLVGGIGVTHYNPKAEIDGTWVRLQPLGTEGQPIGGEYNLVQPILAYGFGCKVDINYKWSLNFELTARKVFADYLDDVSGVYPNVVELQALRGDLAARLSDRSLEVRPEAIGEPGRQRGSSNNTDSYAFLSIGLVYYFGNVLCPPISRPGAGMR